jgi:heavy metal sensor kinase
MSFAKSSSSLATRLTLWYSAIFSLSTLLVFAVIYSVLLSILHGNVRDELAEDLSEFRLLFAQQGEAALWHEIDSEIVTDGEEQAFFRVVNTQSQAQRSTSLAAWPTIEAELAQLPAPQLAQISARISTPAEFEEEVALGAINLNDTLTLQLGVNLKESSEFLEQLQSILLLSLPFIVLTAGVAGWLLARKALQGVNVVTATAGAISKGNFDERVPYSDHGDEINQLSAAFNGMLDKIQRLLRGMREINDSIAHDLRSPLTRIRGQAEAVLTSNQVSSVETYQHTLAMTIEESDRLIGMINTMLDITETEAGLMLQNGATVDISALVTDACDLFQPLAAMQKISFQCQAEDSIVIRGNPSFLQRLVANLVDNALKYTRPGGSVHVRLRKLKDTIELQVEDTGIGIAEQDMTKLFSRFFRCDNSRSQPGNGLGLCLAKAIAKAHQGDIQVSSTLNQGSRFTVSFPVS